jgi:hypothetical protein
MNNNRVTIFIIVMMLIVFSGTGAALSNDGGGSWLFNRELTITNSGGILTDCVWSGTAGVSL